MSATECARLTGLSRERLRTWERRHGFPVPVRATPAARRYAVADIGILVSARRAADAGVPVRDAIARAREAAPAAPGQDALAAAFDGAPQPAVVIAGPARPTIVHVNRAARGRRETPTPGTPLGGELAARVQDAFAGTGSPRFDRPPWSEGGLTVPCMAVPIGDAGIPMLVLHDLETGDEQGDSAAAAAALTDLEAARADLEERDAALDVAARAAELLQVRSGVEALVACIDTVHRALGAIDGALAPYMAGQIVIGRSVRGLLGPDMVTVAAHPSLARVVRDGVIAMLDPSEAGDLGLPDGLGVALVPATCAGEPLGVLVLIFEGRPQVGVGTRRVLALIGTALGLALMQERLLTDETGAGR